jgi:hypothetical protein
MQTLHGAKVISPAGVEAVLRRAALWMPAGRSESAAAAATAPVPLPHFADYAELEAVLPVVVAGIEASLRSHAANGVAILGGQVWKQLGSDRHRWSLLLSDPAIGPLLLRSRVELGRSLMNTGQWRAAAVMLEATLGWLRRAEPGSRESESPDPYLGIRLRRADAWLETYQYLGIVLRGRTPELARSYLHVALSAIRSSPRRLDPRQPALMEGNLERDVAKHLLRSVDAPDADIAAHLERSRRVLEDVGDRAMVTATDMVWADLHSRRADRLRDEDRAGWAAAIEAMEAAIERSLPVFATLDSPMLQANFLTDATRLAGAHGLPMDERRLRRAAELCLDFGYGGQARQLIGLAGVERVLSPEAIGALSDIAHAAEARAAGLCQRLPDT